MILLTLGATTFTLSSCDKSEELNTLSSNTDVVEKPLSTKDVFVRTMHFKFWTIGPNGEIYYIEFYAFDYIDTDNGIEIHIIYVNEAYVNGVKTNIHVYNPQDKDNPFAGKYTIVNADNGFVYGSYNEQDFFEHGTIVK